MLFYGLADYSVQEVVELFVSRDEAEQTQQRMNRTSPMSAHLDGGGTRLRHF